MKPIFFFVLGLAFANTLQAAPEVPVSGSKPSRAESVQIKLMPESETQTVTTAPAIPASRLRAKSPRPRPSRFTSVMSLGYDLRAERGQDQSTLPRTWPTLALGFGWRPWMGVLEYSSFTEKSGNSALSVERKAETLLLWGQWTVQEPWELRPYVGLGVGGYRNWAEIDLYSQKTSASGRWIEHVAGALGVRWMQISPVYLAIEGRIHMNRELDPNPTLGALIKFGFVLE